MPRVYYRKTIISLCDILYTFRCLTSMKHRIFEIKTRDQKKNQRRFILTAFFAYIYQGGEYFFFLYHYHIM